MKAPESPHNPLKQDKQYMTLEEIQDYDKRFQIDRSCIRRMAFNAAVNLVKDIRAFERAGMSARREIDIYAKITKRFKLIDAIAILDASEHLTY